MQTPKLANYGIDAPELVRLFYISGATALILAVVASAFRQNHLVVPSSAIALFGFAACYLLGMGSFMVYESRIGKVIGREKILDQVEWRGDEEVLDVGCGRGLLLVGAARRLKNGRVVGVDIWQAKDQSANGPEGALANAAIENVCDRVEVQTGDMRALPFETASFDIVMSHWVVHNLKLQEDRKIALMEMARVLRSGGTLILTDIAHRSAYVEELKRLGFHNVRVLVTPLRDAILNIVSFGSFRPATIMGSKPRSSP